MRRKCPHENIQFCPLCVASHGVRGIDGKWLGCDDGKIHDGSCAVDRGMSYARQTAKVDASDPGLVADLRLKEEANQEWAEAERRRRQRNRMLH
jgi:hypothetical protein